MGKRLKFCLSERLQTIQEKIAREILPYVDLEWDETESEDNNKNKIREFSTQIDNIKMVVREDGITFTYVNHNDPDGDYTHTKNIEHKLANGDKVKSIVYKMLCDRFDNDNDVVFFRNISNVLYEHANIEKTGKDGKNDNQQKLYL